MRDRFRGAIVGTAIGDAIGAPFEAHPDVPPTALRAWMDDHRPLTWTDDTAMTIGVAESLAAVGSFDGADMAGRFVDHHDAEPWRGYGAGPPQIFGAIRRGAAWHEPAAGLFGGQGSYGNGAAMRVAPVGVFAHHDLDELIATAEQSAVITHAHELGRQGAVWQARAAAWCVLADPSDPARDREGLMDALRAVAPAPVYQRAIDELIAMLADDADDEERRARAVRQLGHGISAVEAVPAATYALLAGSASVEDTVWQAVLLAGDTDTIAAMASALAGALHGHSSIPQAWLDRLERHDRLVEVADALWEVRFSSAAR